MQRSTALGITVATLRATNAVVVVASTTNGIGGLHPRHLRQQQKNLLTKRIRQDDATANIASIEEANASGGLDGATRSLQPEETVGSVGGAGPVEYDLTNWLLHGSQRSVIATSPTTINTSYGCPPEFITNQRYYKGDKVSTCDDDNGDNNCKMYECTTNNGRCFQSGYEPGSALLPSEEIVWEELAPCSGSQQQQWCQKIWRSPSEPWYNTTDVVSYNGRAYKCDDVNTPAITCDMAPGTDGDGWKDLGECTEWVAVIIPTFSPTGQIVIESPPISSDAPGTLAPTTGAPSTTEPSRDPTISPSSASPTKAPTTTPSYSPSNKPTVSPSMGPTTEPSDRPTISHSSAPSLMPSNSPTITHSSAPSSGPSASPSNKPTGSPSKFPSVKPTANPSLLPSSHPTFEPSSSPSSRPSTAPSNQPTNSPSVLPSVHPTQLPSLMPSSHPTLEPSSSPSSGHSVSPSSQPSIPPSVSPSTEPSSQPSIASSASPSTDPTVSPSVRPSASPSSRPTSVPSTSPSVEPTTSEPTASPSLEPSASPSSRPTSSPSASPSVEPTTSPSMQPSASPSNQPTNNPSSSPSYGPTVSPSMRPSASPSNTPTVSPSGLPSSHPTDTPSISPSTTNITTAFSSSVDFLDVSDFMDKKTADTVEVVTKDFLKNALTDRNVECDIVVASQRLLDDRDEEPIRTRRRNLRVEERRLTSSGLKVDLDLSCTASRNGDDVDIEELVETQLRTNIDDYNQKLADNAMFFIQYSQRVDQLLPNEAVGSTEVSTSGSKGTWIGIIVGCVGALAVVVASLFVYNERSSNRRDSVVEEVRDSSYEMRSNKGLRVIHEDEFDGYDLKKAVSKKEAAAAEKSKMQNPDSCKDIATQLRSISEVVKSKSSDVMEEVQSTFLPDKLKEEIKRGNKNIWINAHDEDTLGDQPAVSDLSDPSQADGVISPTSLGGYLDNNYSFQSVADKMIGDQFDTRAIMTPFAPKSGKVGVLGASSRQGNPYPAYSFSSPTSTARSFRSFNKDKVFDVFAPPGPLGVIIDTSKAGPLIHSLRKDSQLKDLVNPGDLIVGLDGEDTRHMTAAKLTRKMASKSGETRKITLLKGLAPPTPISVRL